MKWVSADCECCRRPNSAYVIPGARLMQGQSRNDTGGYVRCVDCRMNCQGNPKLGCKVVVLT